jgi:hypothetical protein
MYLSSVPPQLNRTLVKSLLRMLMSLKLYEQALTFFSVF